MIVNFHPEDVPTKFGHMISSYTFSKMLMVASTREEFHTSQMILLDCAWDRGYTVRIWYQGPENYTYEEFSIGDNLSSGKVLRKQHSMNRLWQAGALGSHLVKEYY